MQAKTDIISFYEMLLSRQDGWDETVEYWRKQREQVFKADPQIGDLVVVFNQPDDYAIGELADCKDVAMMGWPADLRWRVKGNLDWYSHCRRLTTRDLAAFKGWTVEINDEDDEGKGGLKYEH